MSKNISHYVDYRLDQWAHWSMLCQENSLGYPSTNIIARLKDMGGCYIKATGSKPLPTHFEAEEMEKLICEMSQQDKKMALALRDYYDTDQDVMGEKAKDFKLSHTQRMVHVSRAKAWLAGRLSGGKGAS